MTSNTGAPHSTLAFPSIDSKLSAMEGVVTPGRFLAESVGKGVVVRLKDGREYTGTLISYDNYYNIRLKECTEKSKDGVYASSPLKDMFIRCTSIHLIYTVHPKTDGS